MAPAQQIWLISFNFHKHRHRNCAICNQIDNLPIGPTTRVPLPDNGLWRYKSAPPGNRIYANRSSLSLACGYLNLLGREMPPPPLLLGEEVTVHRNRSNYDDTCRARVSVLQLTAPLEEIRGKKRQIDEPLGSTLLRLLRSTIVPRRQIPKKKKKKKQKYRI